MELRDRYRGAMLGLAAGDALGTTLEFTARGRFDPLTDMVGGGPFGLLSGQWTDDTSMALCLATSLVEQQGFDPADQMRRYVRWYREDYLSPTGAGPPQFFDPQSRHTVPLQIETRRLSLSTRMHSAST